MTKTNAKTKQKKTFVLGDVKQVTGANLAAVVGGNHIGNVKYFVSETGD